MTEARVIGDVAEVAPQPSVVTIGFFDGVHLGHRAIVADAARIGRDEGLRTVAVTFDRHPQEVLAPGSQPSYLMSLERRVRTLSDVDLDLILVLPFTLEFSRWSAERFVDDVLVAGLQARHVIIGGNFRYGHKAQGDAGTLEAAGRDHGFTVSPAELRTLEGEAISSTRIRRRLDAGDVAWASAALGRPYWLDGTVVRGEGRGRTIGIPTANVEVDHRLQVPSGGVYAAWAELDADADRSWPAVVNIGTRPTFGGESTTIEAHLLDRDDHDLYGSHIGLGFTHRLRDERRFSGPEELVAQIERDIAEGRRSLAGG